MKLTIERAALLKTLAHVQSAVEQGTIIPILANVLIDASEGHLLLTATDMNLTIVDSVTAEIDDPGMVTVPGRMLHDIIRKMPEGSIIKMSFDGHQIKVNAKRSTFKLPTLPREDFPVTDDIDFSHTFTIDNRDMRKLIDSIRAAISTEETRYFLNGIYLHAPNIDVLHAVATDGHRLSRFEMPLPEGAADMPSVIVPRKTMLELRKLIDETDEAVSVSLSDTRIRFSFGTTLLTSKLIDGTFPDYQRVIPKDNDKVILMECQDFNDAIDRVSTICVEKTRVVKLEFAGNILTLTTNNGMYGTATEEIEIDYDGPEIVIGFNSKYLLDITQQIEGQMKFCLFDPKGAAVVSAVDDPSALYVLMAMSF